MLRSDLCNFNDAYIFVNGDIIVEGDNDANKRSKNLAFKNNAPFINCISKINVIKTDNAEDLDVVMSMCNLREYSKNCRKITGSLWNYYRDEPSNPLSSNSESFKYKTSIVGKTPEDNDSLSNFWRSLHILFINWKVELISTWSKSCVLVDITVDADADSAIVVRSGATFQIADTKLYIPVVTLSKENDTKLLEQLKTGFKRTIKWNKY